MTLYDNALMLREILSCMFISYFLMYNMHSWACNTQTVQTLRHLEALLR